MMSALTNLVTGNKSESFPGQYEGEEVLIFVRRHWMAFVGWIFLALIMLSIPAIVIVAMLTSNGIAFFYGSHLIYTALVVCVSLLVTNAVFLTAWIEHYLDVAIITQERLIHITQIGLFNRHVAELSLSKVQDVSARTNGYIQTLFQYGQVVVESAGEAPNFVMPYAPKPQIIANTILSLHDRLTNTDRSSGRDISQAMSQQPPNQLAEPESSLHISDDLAKQVQNVRPPDDYHHDHFSEDLLKKEPNLNNPSAVLGNQDSGPSPNRLPPPESLKIDNSQGELEEGESVSLKSY